MGPVPICAWQGRPLDGLQGAPRAPRLCRGAGETLEQPRNARKRHVSSECSCVELRIELKPIDEIGFGMRNTVAVIPNPADGVELRID